MFDVIVFKSKEDGAKYYRGEPCNHLKEEFKSLIEATSFATDVLRYLKSGESIVITPESGKSLIISIEDNERKD